MWREGCENAGSNAAFFSYVGAVRPCAMEYDAPSIARVPAVRDGVGMHPYPLWISAPTAQFFLLWAAVAPCGAKKRIKNRIFIHKDDSQKPRGVLLWYYVDYIHI